MSGVFRQLSVDPNSRNLHIDLAGRPDASLGDPAEQAVVANLSVLDTKGNRTPLHRGSGV